MDMTGQFIKWTKKIKLTSVTRSTVLFAVLLVGFAVIMVRLFVIQVLQSKYFKSYAQRQYLTRVIYPARRGEITDRNNITLGIDLDGYSFAADPKQATDDKLKIATKFSQVFAKPINYYLNLLDYDSRFVWLERKCSMDYESQIDVKKLEGMIVLPEFRRYYPWSNIGSTIIGTTGIDYGLSGSEYLFDKTLCGTDGVAKFKRNGLGIARYSSHISNKISGSDLKLSVDILLTKTLRDDLQKAIVKIHGIRSAFSCLIALNSDEILSSVSLPDFDPNDLKTFKDSAMCNRLLNQVFIPGKALDLLFALKTEVIRGDNLVTMQINSEGLREIDCTKSLLKARKKAMLQDVKNTRDILNELGFGHRVNIELPGQDIGYLLQTKTLELAIKNNLSLGDVIICSPIQLSNLYTQVFFGLGLEPSIRFDSSKWNQPVNPLLPLMEGVVLSANGPSNLDSKLMFEQLSFAQLYKFNTYFNDLYMSIGWFNSSGKTILLIVGCEKEKSTNFAPTARLWKSQRDSFLRYEQIVKPGSIELFQCNDNFRRMAQSITNEHSAALSKLIKVKEE